MKRMSKQKAKAELWRRRVESAAKYPGTILEYCQREGISREALRYWRKRLASERHLVSGLESAAPAFATVEILPPASRLPDPRWLAELIHHLQGGAQ